MILVRVWLTFGSIRAYARLFITAQAQIAPEVSTGLGFKYTEVDRNTIQTFKMILSVVLQLQMSAIEGCPLSGVPLLQYSVAT